MKKVLSTKWKYLILGVFVAITIFACFLIPKVKVNYDMTKYLPEDSNTMQALEILDEEFGNYASVELMIEDIEMTEAALIKARIIEVEGVNSVVWLDDLAAYLPLITDPNLLLELQKLQENYYKDNNALYTIVLEDDSYSFEAEETIKQIRNLEVLKNENVSLRGEVLYNIDSRRIAEGETLKIMIVIIPLCILILLLVAKSWIEPLVILLILGVAIALNAGTNLLFADVSYITQTMAMGLQLAITLDYTLFLIHRYYEERTRAKPIEAILIAWKKTIGSITGSALTTIAGFLALLFMQYTIGSDIGLVMGKSVIFSYLSTIFLMPVLILLFSKLLDKTMKKKYRHLNVDWVARVFYKRKYITIALFVIIAGLGLFFQNKVDYLYATTEASDNKSVVVQEEEKIKTVFGINKQVVILVPNGNLQAEALLTQDLFANEDIIAVNSLIGYESLLNIPREVLPLEITGQFVGSEHTRIIINTKIENESELMYAFSEELEETVDKYYDKYYFAGLSTSTTEIKKVVSDDSLIVTLVSILAVALVILIIFRSLSLPLILLLVIQSSIWINMSIVDFRGVEIIFIGFLVIQTLQLGATIDYAVLLSSRYKEYRQTYHSMEAISKSLQSSGISVVISALVLALAGYAEGLLSNISAVREIGILIGRGALISGLLVILVLPSMLLAFDKLIMKTTYKANFLPKKEEI